MLNDYNYYYEQLNPTEKDAYCRISDGFYGYRTEIQLGALFDSDKVKEIVASVLLDDPLLFYINNDSLNYLHNSPDRIYEKLTVSYHYEPHQVNRLWHLIENELEKLFYNIKENISHYEKEMEIIKYIVNRVTYNFRSLERCNFRSHTIIGVFVEKTSVCEGIAKAAKLLFDYAQIPNIVVYGGNHLWNMVKLDNQWYQCDITWSLKKNGVNDIRYNYINLTDKKMKQDHVYDGYPTCKAIKYNPSRMKGFYKSNNIETKTMGKTPTAN